MKVIFRWKMDSYEYAFDYRWDIQIKANMKFAMSDSAVYKIHLEDKKCSSTLE